MLGINAEEMAQNYFCTNKRLFFWRDKSKTDNTTWTELSHLLPVSGVTVYPRTPEYTTPFHDFRVGLGLEPADTGTGAVFYEFLLSSVLFSWRDSSSSSKISTKGQLNTKPTSHTGLISEHLPQCLMTNMWTSPATVTRKRT